MKRKDLEPKTDTEANEEYCLLATVLSELLRRLSRETMRGVSRVWVPLREGGEFKNLGVKWDRN
jgi:hypothetical protein